MQDILTQAAPRNSQTSGLIKVRTVTLYQYYDFSESNFFLYFTRGAAPSELMENVDLAKVLTLTNIVVW